MERLLAHPANLPLVHADHSHRVTPPATGACEEYDPCESPVKVFAVTPDGLMFVGEASYHYYWTRTGNGMKFGKFKEELACLMVKHGATKALVEWDGVNMDGQEIVVSKVIAKVYQKAATYFSEKTMLEYVTARKKAKKHLVVFIGTDETGRDIRDAKNKNPRGEPPYDWRYWLNHVIQ